MNTARRGSTAADPGLADILSSYLGDRLGWYRSLVSDGPATGDELAERTGTHPRYAREWLEQQAVTGLLTVDNDAENDDAENDDAEKTALRRFSLRRPQPRCSPTSGACPTWPRSLGCSRTGGGVGWAQYGPDARESQADMNRPWYERALSGALRSVPELDATLSRPGARIADVGCGGGWSSIALARAYPRAAVDGFDIDAATVDLARANASGSEVADRLTFSLGDAARMPEAAYDAAFAFECVHDMPRPVEVLTATRRALAPGGSVIVMDEAVADSFTAPGDDVERLMYGFSLLVCLPDGMAHQPSAATGTVMRPDTLRTYAHRASFDDVDVLPIQDFGFWRFYQLTNRVGT